MDTNTSLTILVVILSITLLVFLILAIVLTIKLIKVTNHIEVLVQKAETLTDKAAAIGDFFRHGNTVAGLGRLLANIQDAVSRRKGKG